ncbi:MAG: hypothetical protein F4Y03_13090 [Alphaproteobacteria bacterium]|nr:hypothetical protein [Alphaproteobacteria bacterium]
MRTMKHWALAVMTAAALALAGCGGGGSGTTAEMPPPPPSAYETAKAAIMTAETAEAAQAIVDEAADDVSGTELKSLQSAADARAEALATMARAGEQMMALMDAAGMIDTSDLSTQELVDAARAAIAALRQAIDDAADVDDVSMYQSQLDAAVMAVDTAQGGIDTETRRTNQMAALSGASDTLQAALAALSGSTPTQAQLDAANNALNALNMAIMDGADLTETEKAPYQHEADNAAAPIMTAQTAFDNAEDEAEKERIAMMAVTASKLYAGIGAAPLTGHSVTVDATTGVWTVDPNDVAPANLAAQALEADEDTMVADNHGWAGMRYTASGDGVTGTYEATIYSHVGDPTVTEGDAFNEEYTLNADGETGDVTALSGYATSRVASPSFDQDAGAKTFKPGTNDQRVMLGGSYHGVSGTYYCAATDRAVGCSATVADMGFTLAGGTWSFKPANPAAKLMDTEAADILYASYGWWLHKSEDGETFTASAFDTYRGTDAGTVGIADLRGSATYMGGAAGKYSLRGNTGGTNDAGHFTADVMLEATFAADHMISGTISNFMGADGMARDWSVALSKSVIADAGAIAGDPDDNTDTDPQTTTWTIGGTAGGASGQWSGDLREQGDNGVPAIVTGTFHSTYGQGGNDGRMVGAFGANAQ